MINDERWLKALGIQPCTIPNPAAPAESILRVTVRVEYGEAIMPVADFNRLIEANHALHVVARSSGAYWRAGFLIMTTVAIIALAWAGRLACLRHN